MTENPVFSAVCPSNPADSSGFRTTLRPQETVTIPSTTSCSSLKLSVDNLPPEFNAVISATSGGRVFVEHYPINADDTLYIETDSAVTLSFEALVHQESFSYPTISKKYDYPSSSVP